MKFRCFTWNTAKRLKYTSDQVHFIEEINPDIVALQEIIMGSDKKFKELLKNNYPYIVSSFDLVEDKSVLSKKRMFGEIIASKFPLEVQDPNNIDVPWKERVLSAKVILKNHKINFLYKSIKKRHQYYLLVNSFFIDFQKKKILMQYKPNDRSALLRFSIHVLPSYQT